MEDVFLQEGPSGEFHGSGQEAPIPFQLPFSNDLQEWVALTRWYRWGPFGCYTHDCCCQQSEPENIYIYVYILKTKKTKKQI